MKKVSIIVPVYNVEKYIKWCLDSIINQSYTDLEIIIINDGSTDASKLICEFYEKKDKRIILINTENRGASHARNIGLKKATGDYIMYVDSDDSIDLNMVDVLMEYALKYEVDLVEFDDINIINNHKKIKDYNRNFKIISNEKEYFFNRFFRIHGEKNRHLLMNKVIKRKKIKDLVLEEGRINEDILGYYDILSFVDTVLMVKGKMYNYYINKQGVTRKQFSVKDLDLLFMWEQIITKLSKSGNEKYLFYAIQNKKRAYFTLLSKILISGYDKENQEIVKTRKKLKQEFDKSFWEILKIKMPLNRKLLAIYIRLFDKVVLQ